MSVDAVLRLLLEDKASSGVTAFSSTVTAACSTASLAWGAFSGTMSAAMGVAQAVGGSLVALGSVVVESGQKLFTLSEQSAAATNSLNDTARSVGVTANQMQTFMNAAGDIGISTGEASTAFRFLQMNIQQAMTGNEKAIESFRNLGVSFVDETGKAREAYTVMREVGGAMNSMADGAAKTATAVDLFGRSGTRMVPLLSNLDGALESADKQLQDLGQTMSGEMISAAEKFRLAVGDVGDGLGALNSYLGTSMMGVFGEQAEKLAAGIQALFAKIVPELAKVTIAIKIGLLDLLEKIPFEAIGQKVQALAAVASNLIVTGIGVAIRAIDAIPFDQIATRGSSILTSMSTLAAKSWGLLSSMASDGYRAAWDAAQKFGPMMVQVMAGAVTKGVEMAHWLADAWKLVAGGINTLLELPLKAWAKIKGTSMEVFDAMAQRRVEQNKADEEWWGATESRAREYGRMMLSMEGDIKNAIGQTRNVSDQVVDAIAKAAQETSNLKGQTALTVSQAAALKSNFYMAGESAEALQNVAARLGVDLGKLAGGAQDVASGFQSATSYAEELTDAVDGATKAAESVQRTTGAGGSSGGGSTGGRSSVTTPPPVLGYTVGANGDQSYTYIGGMMPGGGLSSGGEWWRTTTPAASPAVSSGAGAGSAVNTSPFYAPPAATGGGASGSVSIGTFGQNNSVQMGLTDPQPVDVNIDGEKLGRLVFKRYAAGAWNMPKSAVKDSR